MPYVRDENVQDSQLANLLGETATFLWKGWPKDMRLSRYGDDSFVLSGQCPHCRKEAAFQTVTAIYKEQSDNGQRMISALQCVACNKFILGIVKADLIGLHTAWAYETHYPLGKPNDKLPEEIPPSIAADFSEGIRCRWVDAYNATVEMCRRALESSCIQLEAPEKLGTLEKMIDWVCDQGKITKPLRDMAHKIRLGGDRGAHPSTRIMGEDDADAVIEFTKEYLDHVYVMPAKMAKFDFSRPKLVKPVPDAAGGEK